jgi:nucleoside-diphosphate-sugar epimerase
MTILLTGSTGFVGANLLRALLKREKEVHVFLRENSDIWRIRNIIGEAKVHYCDLVNRENVLKEVSKIGPSKIFHLATCGGYPDQNDFYKITTANFLGTANLLDACAQFDFDCFINTGTSSEYGVKTNPMREEDILEPVSTYGVAKAAATLYCQSVAKRCPSKIFTLRLFSPFGYFEGANRLIPYVINNCLSNQELELSNPRFTRDFVFVEDVIRAYFCLTKAAKDIANGEIFNVGSGRQHTIEEIVNTISSLTHYSKPAKWGAKAARVYDMTGKWEADIEKIRRIADWEPEISLEEGLTKTIKWFKNNPNLGPSSPRTKA